MNSAHPDCQDQNRKPTPGNKWKNRGRAPTLPSTNKTEAANPGMPVEKNISKPNPREQKQHGQGSAAKSFNKTTQYQPRNVNRFAHQNANEYTQFKSKYIPNHRRKSAPNGRKPNPTDSAKCRGRNGPIKRTTEHLCPTIKSTHPINKNANAQSKFNDTANAQGAGRSRKPQPCFPGPTNTPSGCWPNRFRGIAPSELPGWYFAPLHIANNGTKQMASNNCRTNHLTPIKKSNGQKTGGEKMWVRMNKKIWGQLANNYIKLVANAALPYLHCCNNGNKQRKKVQDTQIRTRPFCFGHAKLTLTNFQVRPPRRTSAWSVECKLGSYSAKYNPNAN